MSEVGIAKRNTVSFQAIVEITYEYHSQRGLNRWRRT